jgi:hypothetical protein
VFSKSTIKVQMIEDLFADCSRDSDTSKTVFITSGLMRYVVSTATG